MNLCNSFTLKQNSANFFSRYRRNHMGCDYYIDKDLHIYYSDDKEIAYINLEHERGYYWFISTLDEDEDGYNEELEEYKKQKLEPTMKPIVIYSNNTFSKLSFESKYKQMIETDINRYNKTLNDVDKIIKVENRYQRW